MPLVVVGNGKTMGFLLNLTNEGKHRLAGLNTDLMPPGRNQRAGAVPVVLNHAEHRKVQAEARKHRFSHCGMGRATVNQEQVRQRGKFFVPHPQSAAAGGLKPLP